jgi:hypothetical protein
MGVVVGEGIIRGVELHLHRFIRHYGGMQNCLYITEEGYVAWREKQMLDKRN